MTGTWSKCSAKPPGPSPAAAATSTSSTDRPFLERPVGDHRPGGQSGTDLGEVLVPTRQVGVPHRPPEARVLDHDDPPCLPVAAVRCEPGGVEEAVEGLVGDRRLLEFTHRAGRAECRQKLHH